MFQPPHTGLLVPQHALFDGVVVLKNKSKQVWWSRKKTKYRCGGGGKVQIGVVVLENFK